jgi:hypothetical protein
MKLVPSLKEEHRLRMFQNRVMMRKFEPKRDKVTGGRKGLHNLYASSNVIRGHKIKEDEIGGACSTNVIRCEMHTKFWSENLKRRDHPEELGVDGRIILE